MCCSGYSLTKTRFTSLIAKSSPSSRRVSQDNDINLLTIDDVPGWMLMRKASLVSDAFSSFPLELVRGKEHPEAFTLLLWSLLSKLCFKPGHQDNASAVSVSLALQIVSDVSRCGQQLLVGHRQTNSSCCSSLTSRFAPVLHRRTSCW